MTKRCKNYSDGVNSPVSALRVPFPYFSDKDLANSDSWFFNNSNWSFK